MRNVFKSLLKVKISSLTVEERRSIYDYAAVVAGEHMKQLESITSSEKLEEVLMNKYRTAEREIFGVVWVDSQHQILSFEEISKGTINAASVYCREILKSGLKVNASACFCYHNHPSGISEPSQADIQITTRIKDALKYVDITLLDHAVLGKDSFVSLAQRGLL